ncbi:MAG: arsenate reductase (glutaredoxin) [Candidatus Hydrogenedentota bacterium]
MECAVRVVREPAGAVMKKVVIYHNPKCAKSRETLALLRGRGIEPEIVEYLAHPPSKDELRAFIRMLGGDAHALVRAKEPDYRKAGLSKSSSTDDIVNAIAKYPILMERPLVVCGKRAALGRPPENVVSILS